jgi:hypothetical protein
MQPIEVLILSCSLTPVLPAFFGLFACLDFDPCPLFLSLSLSWVLFFYEVWQGFITLCKSQAYSLCFLQLVLPNVEYHVVF